MNPQLLAELRKITPEEQKILDGAKEVDEELYYMPRSHVVDSKKLLESGKSIQIRTHTRFVHFPAHTHNFVELIYMCSGSTTHKVNGEIITLKEGELLFLNQNATQEIYPAGEDDIAVNFIILPAFFDYALTMLGDDDNYVRDFLMDCLKSENEDISYLHFRVADVLPIQNLMENLIWTLHHEQVNKRSIHQVTMGLLLLQLMNVNDPDITEENYMRVIYSKTARLFEAAAQCSGILAGCTPEEEKGLQDYGRYLGTAFQLIDDLLDYNADGEQLGKNVGDDLNEGKPTLPLLHAMHHGTPEQAQMIRTAIEQGNGRHLLEPVLEAMNACGSLEWTRQRAEEEADKAIAALQVLPDTPWREALIGLAHIAVQRDR